MTATAHAAHDALVETVEGWYTRSYPEMGHTVEERRYGYYWREVKAVYLKHDLTPAHIPALLADAAECYGPSAGTVGVFTRSRAVDATLGPALLAAGCSPRPAEFFLAHVGPVPIRPKVAGLALEPVTHDNVAQWVRLKQQAFGDGDIPPHAEDADLRDEIGIRRNELGGGAGGLFARFDGAPAGIIWWYGEETDPRDLYVALLAVRRPMRRQGIAQALLCGSLASGYAQGYRSVLISVLEGNDPAIRLYRKLGFTDEIIWRHRYNLSLER